MPVLLGRQITMAAMAVVATLTGCDVRKALLGPAKLTGKVKEVVDRTKVSPAIYSNYGITTVVLDDGTTKTDWGAEFNDGIHRHRVEVSLARLVADCQAMTGSMISLVRNESHSGPSVAQAACGIDTSSNITDSAYLGVMQTPWGRADRVRLTVGEVARVYDVNKDGVIVSEAWYKGASDAKVILKNTVIAVLPTVPSHDMYDEASLQKSFTPDQYKAAPKP